MLVWDPNRDDWVAYFRKLRAWFLRAAGTAPSRRRDREFDAELEHQLDLHISDNLRLGMAPEDARRIALQKLGGLQQTKEAYRERTTLPTAEITLRDLRYTLRTLRKNRGVAAVAVATLTLGIAASTVVFSVVRGVLIESVPYPHPSA